MIIDDKHYLSEDERKPQQIPFSLSTMTQLFRMASLLYSAGTAIARPIANAGLIYSDQPDPLMPMPHYPSENAASLHQRIPFTGRLNATSDIVIAGDHTMGYEPDYHWLTQCFDFKHLVTVLLDSVTELSAASPVNYKSAVCKISEAWSTNYGVGDHSTFDSTVYGLTDYDCAAYQSRYTERATHCIDTLDRNQIYHSLLMMGAFLGSLIFLTLACGLGNRAARVNFVYDALANHDPDLLSNTRGISSQLKIFLSGIELSAHRISALTERQRLSIEEDDDNLCCSIHKELMDMPVLLDGKRYEFRALLALNPRLDPTNRLPFNLNEIQADRETRGKIERIVTELTSTAQERPLQRLESA